MEGERVAILISFLLFAFGMILFYRFIIKFYEKRVITSKKTSWRRVKSRRVRASHCSATHPLRMQTKKKKSRDVLLLLLLSIPHFDCFLNHSFAHTPLRPGYHNKPKQQLSSLSLLLNKTSHITNQQTKTPCTSSPPKPTIIITIIIHDTTDPYKPYKPYIPT